MGPNCVTHHPGNTYPWRQLKDLSDKIAVEFEICKYSSASEETQRYVTGFEILGEPWEGGKEGGEGGSGRGSERRGRGRKEGTMRKVTDRHDLSTGRELFALYSSIHSDSLSKLLDNFLLHKVSHSLLVSHEHVERLYVYLHVHSYTPNILRSLRVYEVT